MLEGRKHASLIPPEERTRLILIQLVRQFKASSKSFIEPLRSRERVGKGKKRAKQLYFSLCSGKIHGEILFANLFLCLAVKVIHGEMSNNGLR